MASWIQYTCVLALFFLSGRAGARKFPCACSPSTITFELNFAGTCPPVTILDGTGAEAGNDALNATFCQITPIGGGDSELTDDLIPAKVTDITAIELGQSFQVIDSIISLWNETNPPLENGDSVTFNSIIDTSRTENLSFFDDAENVPQVLQIIISGENENGDKVQNTFAISYTNRCDVYEVIGENSQAGWTTVVSSTGYENSNFLCFQFLNFNSLV